MNERIMELADKAFAEYESDTVKYEARIPDEFCLKFAELIVRECMNICDEVQDQYGQYTFTARVCKERFQEHFGVKE